MAYFTAVFTKRLRLKLQGVGQNGALKMFILAAANHINLIFIALVSPHPLHQHPASFVPP